VFQLYLLTVLTNILAGHALASGFLDTRFKRLSKHTSFAKNGLYRIILGTVSVLVGIINLFPNYPGDIAILGDLLPSAGGIAGGILLWTDYIRSRKSVAQTKTAEVAEKIEKISVPYLNVIGLLLVLIGILHAVFVQVSLL